MNESWQNTSLFICSEIGLSGPYRIKNRAYVIVEECSIA